uniref:Translocator protein n=1 Tax=Hucho hucho TaxID=62062 RepID=A0A4W5NYP9_9TELE
MSWLPMLCLTAMPHLGVLYGGYIIRKQVKTWYPTLNKPSWCLPNAAFPIVLTTLNTGMGSGSYLVWKECGGFTEDAVAPLGLYGLQLALNWAWTPIFFGTHKFKMVRSQIMQQLWAHGFRFQKPSSLFNVFQYFCQSLPWLCREMIYCANSVLLQGKYMPAKP